MSVEKNLPVKSKLRANRVDSNYKDLFLLSEIRLDTIFKELEKHPFEVLVIDSIQTIYSQENLFSSRKRFSSTRNHV